MGMAVERQRVAGVWRFSASVERVAVFGRVPRRDGLSSEGRSFLRGRVPPPLTPPHKGEGGGGVGASSISWAASRDARRSPSPLWGGVRGGGDSLRGNSPRVESNLLGTDKHPGRNTEGGPLPRHPADPRTHMAAEYP